MSFDIDSFADIGGQTRKGMAPAVWSYESKGDNLAEILTPDYFAELALHVSPGDFISLSLLGGKSMITVESVDLMPPGMVVIDPEVFMPGGGGNVFTNDILAATQLLLGDGAMSIVTEPKLTFSGGVLGVDGSIDLATDGVLSFDGTLILEDVAGVMTLRNVNALDSTTETTIEMAIDHLFSLNFIRGFAVEFNDPNADSLWGWKDSEAKYRNMSIAEIQAIVDGVTTSDVLATTQLLVGNGLKDIATVPALTWSGTLLDILSSGDDTSPVLQIQSTTNGGIVGFLTGDRNPNGLISSLAPNVYHSIQGALSGTYENRGAGSTSIWLKRSVLPGEILEIHNSAELDALASGGVITITSDVTWRLRGALTTANRIVVNPFVNLTILGESNAGVGITYTGTGTFLTVLGFGFLDVLDKATLTSSSTGTFISAAALALLNFRRMRISGWDDLGTITAASAFVAEGIVFQNIDSGFVLNDNAVITISDITQIGSPISGSLFTIDTNNPVSVYIFDNIVLNSISAGASMFDFNTRMNNLSSTKITNSAVISGDLFKQTVLADATINSVSDGSPATGTLTAMADNGSGGTTVSCTTTYFEDEELTLSATTNYNDTYQIFNVVAGVSFDIIEPFAGDDATGSADSERLTLALAGGHGISTGDSLKIIDTNFYNGFETALNVVTNDVTVNGGFIDTDDGAIERVLSLDQSDPRIVAALNVNTQTSHFIACAHVNDNSTANGSITNGVFTDQVFGTAGDALLASSTMERWRLVNEILGIFEYISHETFDGNITFDFTLTASGEADFRVKWEIDTGSGFGDLPDDVEALASIKDTATSVSKTFPLKAEFGDQIRPQITRNSGSETITTNYATIYVSM